MLRPCPGPFHFIQLCSPVSAKSVPAGDGWVHEPKMDGYRLQVVKDGPTVRLFSRRGYDWTKRLTVFAEALRAIRASYAILDAALCFPGPDGAPNFFGLHSAMHRKWAHDLAVIAFDLLHLNGEDFRPMPPSGPATVETADHAIQGAVPLPGSLPCRPGTPRGGRNARVGRRGG
jgi:bifunctional non-homologous end joining protein LigD